MLLAAALAAAALLGRAAVMPADCAVSIVQCFSGFGEGRQFRMKDGAALLRLRVAMAVSSEGHAR